jgi:hypothetical protein
MEANQADLDITLGDKGSGPFQSIVPQRCNGETIPVGQGDFWVTHSEVKPNIKTVLDGAVGPDISAPSNPEYAHID